jgi:ribosome-associated protein
MAEHLQAVLEPAGVRAHHVEGISQGRWILLDYVDFVVHVFHPEQREFYQLERLWDDAAVVGTTPDGGPKG